MKETISTRALREAQENQREQYQEQARNLGGGLGTSCTETGQCASGYGCVNGECVAIDVGVDYGSPAGPGGCEKRYQEQTDCNQTKWGCQVVPNCGDGQNYFDVKGSRYYRNQKCCGGTGYYYSSGGVRSKCESSRVEKKPGCDEWCASWAAFFGETAAGCEGTTACDPYCERCSLGSCVPDYDACWCNGGASCGNCEACISDPSNPNFGGCAKTPTSVSRCDQCVTIDSYKCCGADVGPISVCSKATDGTTTNDLRAKARAKAKESCAKICDECEQTSYKTYCSDTTGTDYTCPPGVTCTETGNLSAGGVDCVYVKEVDRSNCPDCPTEPVCNCHSDCPPGYTCTGLACVPPGG